MRILVHDYSGHPFQAELSRALAGRGHEVLHSTCVGYVSGKGHLRSTTARLRFATIGAGPVLKQSFFRRSLQELGYGFQLVSQLRRERPDVVLVSNAPIPTLVVVACYLMLRRTPWVLWHQDVQAVALRSFAGDKLDRRWVVAAKLVEVGERWCARRATAIVVIADSFVPVHRAWGTAAKVSVIPNWAPLDQIVPVERHNAWSAEQHLDGVTTLLYSGTLGLKHNPELLAELTARVRELGVNARLVVVNEGPAVERLRRAARRLGVPATLLPFQPYDRLSEVLGAGDVLVVLLERSAGAFSVPSKTLSYLCAARPVLGLMPAENLAAELLDRAGCPVFSPELSAADAAAQWVVELVSDPARSGALSRSTRALAEQEFSLAARTDRFEAILDDARH